MAYGPTYWGLHVQRDNPAMGVAIIPLQLTDPTSITGHVLAPLNARPFDLSRSIFAGKLREHQASVPRVHEIGRDEACFSAMAQPIRGTLFGVAPDTEGWKISGREGWSRSCRMHLV